MGKERFVKLTTQEAISKCEDLINSQEDSYYCFQIVEGFRNGDFSDNGKPDIETYLYWLTKLAENNSYYAMNRLGQIYGEGEFVIKDIDKAKFWFTKALPFNDYVVKQNFAYILLVKSDSPDDNKYGFDLCVESINDAGKDGAYILGIACDEGLGIKQNLNYSFYLYQIAAATSKWCRNQAETILTMFKSDYIKPVTYLDFFPNNKYEGSVFGREDMKKAVYDGIDFDLSAYHWHLIDSVFKYYWNKNYRDVIDFEALSDYVIGLLKCIGINLAMDKLNKIMDIMIDFVKCTGGIIQEDKEFIYWYNETDMLDHGYFSPLTTLISYDYKQRSFITVISQFINDEKMATAVWCRSKDIKTFAGNISKFIFNDINYQKYFAIATTKHKGISRLYCVIDSVEIADLYIIDDDSINVFDICDLIHLCKRDYNIEAVFVDDIDFIALPSELISLKKCIALQWSIIVFKALARSLEVPVLIQKSVAHKHQFSEENTPTLENAVPLREWIEEIPDRIVVVYYDENDDISLPHYTVVKDNKYSNGRVIFIDKKDDKNE